MSDFNKNREFRNYFNTQDKFRDYFMCFVAGKYVLDIFKFELWCRETHGYNEEEHGSLQNFLISKFGKKAEEFIVSVL